MADRSRRYDPPMPEHERYLEDVELWGARWKIAVITLNWSPLEDPGKDPHPESVQMTLQFAGPLAPPADRVGAIRHALETELRRTRTLYAQQREKLVQLETLVERIRLLVGEG